MDISILTEKELADSDCELESFVPKHVEDCFQGQCRSGSVVQHNDIWLLSLVAILLIYLMTSIPFLYFAWYQSDTGSPHHVPAPPYSPASGAVRYTVKESAPAGINEFVGPPSNASERVWLDLVRPTLISISHEEMVMANEDPEHSVKLEGSGYMGSLGVYHELHCLRRLKLYLYKEYYYPEMDSNSAEKEYEVKHLDHCIDTIRQSLMCAGNPALYTFQWVRNVTGKPLTKTNSNRVCVDFEALKAWNSERSIGFSPALVGPEWED